MSDITQAVVQQEIADSILGDDNVVAQLSRSGELQQSETQHQGEEQESYFADSLDLLDQEIKERAADRFQLGDYAADTQEDRQRRQAEAEPEEVRSQASVSDDQQIASQPGPEPTAAELQQTMTVLDTAVQEFGLSQNRGALSTELAGLFGFTAQEAGLKAEALEQPLERAFVSSFDSYVTNRQNLGALPPIPDAAAKSFAYDFLEGLGQDPRRIANLDSRTVAYAIRGANLSIFTAFEQSGGSTDVRRWNDPAVAETTVNVVLQAIGGKPVSRDQAVAIADAYAKWMVGNIQRVQQRQASMQQQAAPARGARRAQSGRRIPSRFSDGIKGEQAPRFKTNADIFAPGVVAAATTQRL